MQSIALVIHVLLAVGVIGLVLIQHGKGADAGAAFGSGASATVFGARGASSFLTRMTTAGAVLFFATSLFLFWIAAHRDSVPGSVTDVPGLVDEAPLPAAPVDDGDLPGTIAPAVEETDPMPAAPVEAPLGESVPDEALPAPVDAPVEQENAGEAAQ